MSPTQERILNAAERLFAERGFAGASLRAITAAAGVNLAAVNYHFRSKDELLRALYARRLEPVNARRLQILDELEREARGKAVPLDKLVAALVGPLLESKADGDGIGLPVLLGRVYVEPGGLAFEILKEQMAEIARRFGVAFRRALPHLSPIDLAHRMHFVIGSLAHTMAAPKLLDFLSGGACDWRDVAGMERRLVAFAVAGLKAPATTREPKPRSRKP